MSSIPDMLSRAGLSAHKSNGNNPAIVFFKINVVDPVKQDQGGLNPYVTYKVNTTTNNPAFQHNQFSVIRRYKDFRWLSECLLEEFPGVVCPPLPDREALKRFEPEYIEKRRAELEKFLARISTHDELSESETFLSFLQADDASINELKDETKVQLRASGHNLPGADIKRHFGWVMTALKFQMGMDSQAQIKTQEDIKFDEISTYIAELDTQVQTVAKHVGSLVRRQEALGSTAFDLGFALTQLATAERDSDSLRKMLELAGDKVDAASITIKVKAQREAEFFEVPISEYVKIINSVKMALAKRQEKKLIYMFAVNDVESRAAAHAKLLGITGKGDKVASALIALNTARTRMETAKGIFDIVSNRVLREFDRFKREKAADLQKMLKAFVMAHIECNRLEEECWQQLLSTIENMDIK